MPRIFVFLFGYTRYSFEADRAAQLVELCRRRGIVYRDISFCKESKEASVDIPLFYARKFEKLCESVHLPVQVRSRHGLPSILMRYRRRYGAIFGALLFIFLSLFSGSLLWDIRVEGNSILSDRQVVEILDACGLSVGMPVRGIPTALIETKARIMSEDIAWISINILGSVAEVHIIEDDGARVEEAIGSDIVAERGGVIQWIEDIRGHQAVEIGPTVEEGQLLISGKYPAEEGESERYTTPRGKVYAKTLREFSVFIPYEYEKKTYTGEEKCQKYFIFFKKEIKFFENCGKMYTECDTIDTVEYFSLPGGVALPFGVRTVRYIEYEKKTATRSQESAIELALYTLRCRMESDAGEGMLTKKTLVGSLGERGYELLCRAEYIEDIARYTNAK